MRKSLLLAGLLGVGFSAPATVMAEEAAATEAAPAAAAPAPDWAFPASISLVSDYIFRGQSQTWGRPAVQVSIEAQHKSGFYAGFFGSNVSDEWLPGANLETDWYAGYRGKISEIGFDVGGIYYYYPGGNWKESAFIGSNSPNSLNTFEIYASLSYKWLSVKVGRTLSEYWGWNTNNSADMFEPTNGGIGDFNGDANAGVTGDTKGSYFYEANAAYEVFPTWTLSGQVGRQVVADSDGLDITYYKAGITKAFSTGWSVGAFYSGSSQPDAYENFVSLRSGRVNDDSDIARNTGFITITKAF